MDIHFVLAPDASCAEFEWQQRTDCDYDHRTIDLLTSTPHQPANACLALSLLPIVNENGRMQVWKMREIKGLLRKSLFLINYWNRWGLGS
jgi:hypothetical protein